MALVIDRAYAAINTVNLWYKQRNGETFMITDIPELLKYRWPYFRDNWNQIRKTYIDNATSYVDPNLLSTHIKKFDDFIDLQRHASKNINPFNNTNVLYTYYAVFDSTPINTINLTAAEQQLVNDVVKKLVSMSRSDFITLRGYVSAARDYVTDTIGLSDDDYNRIYGNRPATRQLDPNNSNLNIIYQLQATIKGIDFILANFFSLENAFVDQFALARQNANNPEIDIATYNSGSLSRLNYGENLQQLAARALGDPSRWIEIAIANGLKPPYVDEFGSTIPLLSNASTNLINLAGTDATGQPNINKLYTNQFVYIQSNSQPFPDQRRILNIRTAAVSGEIILELSGEPNLSQYTLADSAHIRIYKPNTINSSQYILIPNSSNIDNDVKKDTPWFLQGEPESEKQQKVDFLLDEFGDLVLGSNNDLSLSYGLNNAAQAIRLKFQVEAGELPQHVDFGLIPIAGASTENISEVKSILVNSINDLILADSRFDRVERLDVEQNSTALLVTMSVKIAGSNQILPITFSVPLR